MNPLIELGSVYIYADYSEWLQFLHGIPALEEKSVQHYGLLVATSS